MMTFQQLLNALHSAKVTVDGERLVIDGDLPQMVTNAIAYWRPHLIEHYRQKQDAERLGGWRGAELDRICKQNERGE